MSAVAAAGLIALFVISWFPAASETADSNNDVPIFRLSYMSTDGGVTFTQNTSFNFRFSLVLSEP
jgi:hypothetical protein